MTVQQAHGSAHESLRAPARILAVALVTSALERLRRAADLRAARKRRRLRLQTFRLLDDRIYSELSQARRDLEITYRNNLDCR